MSSNIPVQSGCTVTASKQVGDQTIAICGHVVIDIPHPHNKEKFIVKIKDSYTGAEDYFDNVHSPPSQTFVVMTPEEAFAHMCSLPVIEDDQPPNPIWPNDDDEYDPEEFLYTVTVVE